MGKIFKIMINKFIAFFILIGLFPLFLFISLLLLLSQGRPIFYSQRRVGKDYAVFSLFKFRTMVNDINGPEITEINDKRITTIGKVLRKLKIDELPQIINIIIGDLNFVGPRPEVEKFVNEYDFSFLKKIKPGLTDFSSILFSSEEILLSKLGGAKHYHKILPIKLDLINHYIIVRNIWVDCKIIILTIIGLIMPTLAKTRIKKVIYKNNPDLFNKITSIGI